VIDFYVNPDTLYRINAYVDAAELGIYTFMYGEKLGFYWDSGDVSHMDILRRLDKELDAQIGDEEGIENIDPELLARYRYVDKLYGLLHTDLEEAQQHMLMGRAAPMNQIPDIGTEDDYTYLVTFWNDDMDVYGELLPTCMLHLYDNNLITDPVIINTPIFIKNYSSGEVETQGIARDPTPSVDKKELERMRQLHLMRGDEKKKAMQELGLATASQKHPMQAALEKSGYINPGQKWWASTSESFSRKLNQILEQHNGRPRQRPKNGRIFRHR